MTTHPPGRIHGRATIIATVALAVFTAMWLLSYALDPKDQHLSPTRTFHVALGNGCVSFFNDEDYGPYRGSLIAIVDKEGHTYPAFLHRTGWDFPGFYYRYFRTQSYTLWTLTISLLWPALAMTILLLITLGLARRRHLSADLTESEPP